MPSMTCHGPILLLILGTLHNRKNKAVWTTGQVIEDIESVVLLFVSAEDMTSLQESAVLWGELCEYVGRAPSTYMQHAKPSEPALRTAQ